MKAHDRVPRRPSYPTRDICLILLEGIGDVVHGLPVAVALKADDRDRRITWLADPVPAEVVRGHPAVDEVIVFHRRLAFAGIERLTNDMRGRHFDVAINTERFFKGILPTLLAGAPVRVGLDRRRATDPGVWLSCNRHLEPRPWAHGQDVYMEFLDYLGVPRPGPFDYGITFSPAELASRDRFFGALPPGPVVAFVLASAIHRKDWPAERYGRLADELARDPGCTILLVGGPGGRERAAARVVRERSSAEIVDAMGDGVRRLMWIISGCDLLVSPDSGPLHLAHALDVPVVGLYGHTNPARAGPYRRFRDLVVDRFTDPGETPDPSSREARRGRMERISVDEVAERVRLAFERYVRRRPIPPFRLP